MCKHNEIFHLDSVVKAKGSKAEAIPSETDAKAKAVPSRLKLRPHLEASLSYVTMQKP